MDNAIKLQAQIRHNAEELSSYLSDLSKWEKEIDRNGVKLSKKRVSSGSDTKNNIRDGAGTIKVVSTNSSSEALNKSLLTPATIIRSDVIETSNEIPKSRGQVNAKDAETMERERGNNEYQIGNFQVAVKCYTKCLGLKVGNYIAFSNRAMAYIKLKEYAKAESDCSCALSIEPNHVKSLQRRASARNSLGKHRAALMDLQHALSIEPSNKTIVVDHQKTKELLRNSVNRAPLVKLTNFNEGNFSEEIREAIVGPDLPLS